MLILCPECQLQISDKAISCPHCGYPLKPEKAIEQPHDCRVQFITMAKKYQVDDYAIKRIVGHTISDLTEAVYTKQDTEWLRSEIEKIKGM